MKWELRGGPKDGEFIDLPNGATAFRIPAPVGPMHIDENAAEYVHTITGLYSKSSKYLGTLEWQGWS